MPEARRCLWHRWSRLPSAWRWCATTPPTTAHRARPPSTPPACASSSRCGTGTGTAAAANTAGAQQGHMATCNHIRSCMHFSSRCMAYCPRISILQDQYLELSTWVNPSAYIYGAGERASSTTFMTVRCLPAGRVPLGGCRETSSELIVVGQVPGCAGTACLRAGLGAAQPTCIPALPSPPSLPCKPFTP